MIMLGPFPYEASDELEENEELFLESEENEEAAPRPGLRRPPLRLPQRGNAVPPRVRAGFVTHAELKTTADRLDARIGTVSTAVKTLDGRVRTIDTEQRKLRTDIGKEAKERRLLSERVNNLQQMSMMMPLFSTQSTVTANLPTPAGPVQANVVVDKGDNLMRMLPVLMFSGAMGGTGSGQSGSGGGMMGGDNSAMTMVMLMMAMQK
jgi:hypothetical protein